MIVLQLKVDEIRLFDSRFCIQFCYILRTYKIVADWLAKYALNYKQGRFWYSNYYEDIRRYVDIDVNIIKRRKIKIKKSKITPLLYTRLNTKKDLKTGDSSLTRYEWHKYII